MAVLKNNDSQSDYELRYRNEDPERMHCPEGWAQDWVTRAGCGGAEQRQQISELTPVYQQTLCLIQEGEE